MVRMVHTWLAGRAVIFALGVASTSLVMEVAGAPLRRAARAATRQIVKGSFLVSRELRRIGDSVTQEVEDITAEVRAEFERDEGRAAETPDEAAVSPARARAPGRPRSRKA